jgi:hypothetical protein
MTTLLGRCEISFQFAEMCFVVTETFDSKVMLDREVNNRRYTRGAAAAVAQAVDISTTADAGSGC